MTMPRYLLPALLFLTSVACSSSDDDKNDKDPPETEVTTIGPAGGTLTGPNGSSVVVPAGALATELELAITANPTDGPAAPTDTTSLGAVYALTPHGTAFAAPATIRIPFDASSVPAGTTPTLYKAEVGGTYAALTTTVSGSMLEASIDGFSYVTPGAPFPAEGAKYNAISGPCARRSLSGIVDCWGDLSGLLNNEDYESKLPTAVANSRAFGVFSASVRTICGLSGTELWCAGAGFSGLLGNGQNEGSAAPVKVSAPEGIAFGDVSVGYLHVCAIVASSDEAQDGKLYCWGDNTRGQLGIGNSFPQNTPQIVSSPYRYANVVAAGSSTCATRSTGEVDCWGDNSYGQFGNGYVSNGYAQTPNQVANVQIIAARGTLSGNGRTFCGLRGDGETVCWGYNYYGQIGDDTKGTGNTSDPNDRKGATVVLGGHQFKTIAVAFSATCAATATGETYCWGDVRNNAQHVLTPAAFGSLPNKYKLIDWPADNTWCGVAFDDNTLYCWGEDGRGFLGQGTMGNAQYNEPVAVSGQ